MRSVCFFASYFTSNDLPYYVTVYLNELKKHFTEVVLLTSQKELSLSSKQFLSERSIQISVEENEGFDFGLWYKAFQRFDLNSYDTVALVNDSCILFASLDEFMNWSKYNDADFQGITRSEAIAPHIQSYFLVLKKNAIQPAKAYFEIHKLQKNIADVIKVYEIGLSLFLSSKGLKMAAFINNDNYKGEFSPYYHCVEYHLKKKIPLIKKKILFASYRKDELFTLARMNFNISPNYYVRLIKNFNYKTILDFQKLQSDKVPAISQFYKTKYFIDRMLILIVRSIFKRN